MNLKDHIDHRDIIDSIYGVMKIRKEREKASSIKLPIGVGKYRLIGAELPIRGLDGS